MPPKVKIAKEDIVKTAVELVRASGEQAINARSVAAALGCSTQPVFSNFKTMEQLLESVTLAAHALYLDFLCAEAARGEYPQYKAFGMAYIRFAMEERELFRLLFMCDRGGEAVQPSVDFTASVEMIMKANGVTKEKAERMHLEMWVAVHGIATIFATSFLSLELTLVSDMLTDIYQGLRARHLENGDLKNGSN